MFAREGASGITITYLPEEEADVKDAKKMIEDSGAQCNTVCVDLMDHSACQKLVESHIQKFGKLNILVNNASKQLYVLKAITSYDASELMTILQDL